MPVPVQNLEPWTKKVHSPTKMIGLSLGTHGTDLEIDCWYIRENWERYRHSYTGVTIRTRSEPLIGTVRGFKKNGIRKCSRPKRFLVQHRGQASEWPGTESIPSENINRGSEKKLNYSFRKVPGLLHGGNDQNSLAVPDRNQIVRGFKKNGLRSAQFRKSDKGVFFCSRLQSLTFSDSSPQVRIQRQIFHVAHEKWNSDNLWYALRIRKDVQSDNCPVQPKKFDIISPEPAKKMRFMFWAREKKRFMTIWSDPLSKVSLIFYNDLSIKLFQFQVSNNVNSNHTKLHYCNEPNSNVLLISADF